MASSITTSSAPTTSAPTETRTVQLTEQQRAAAARLAEESRLTTLMGQINDAEGEALVTLFTQASPSDQAEIIVRLDAANSDTALETLYGHAAGTVTDALCTIAARGDRKPDGTAFNTAEMSARLAEGATNAQRAFTIADGLVRETLSTRHISKITVEEAQELLDTLCWNTHTTAAKATVDAKSVEGQIRRASQERVFNTLSEKHVISTITGLARVVLAVSRIVCNLFLAAYHALLSLIGSYASRTEHRAYMHLALELIKHDVANVLRGSMEAIPVVGTLAARELNKGIRFAYKHEETVAGEFNPCGDDQYVEAVQQRRGLEIELARAGATQITNNVADASEM